MLPTKLREATDRGRALVPALQAERAVVVAQDARRRQVREQALPHPDRTGARATAAVRRAERLVDVEVHDVEPGLAGLEPAEDGVEVRAVHVGQRAGLVDGSRSSPIRGSNSPSVDGLVIITAAVRGPRAASNASTSTPPSAADGIVIVLKPAIEAVAGIRPVAGVGDEDLVALVVAARAVVGPDHEDPGQLALGAGGRLQGDGAHAADLGQRALELPEQLAACPARPRRAPSGAGRRSRAAGRPTR